MAADHRKDHILRKGDRICCADAVYIITENPIGYGGSAIVYPARRTDTQLKYVIKECFPKTGAYRRENGVIVPRDPGDAASHRMLETLSRGVAREQRVGQLIHNTGDRAVCIRQILRPQAICTGGRTFSPVSGGCFAVLDQLDPDSICFDDLLGHIADSYTPQERQRTQGLPDIHTTACIMEEILSALQQVHHAPDPDHPQVCGFYFGDLHGGNVYFSGSRIRSGVVGRARLIDFGSAWELDKNGQTRLLSSREVFSAEDIRPPEMDPNGSFRLSRAADIFSAGCLMARCVMTKIQLDTHSRLMSLGSHALFPDDCGRISCPPELLDLVNHILDRATALREQDRYPNTAEMLEDIRTLKERSAPLKNRLGLGLSTLAEGEFKGRSREIKTLNQVMNDGFNPVILHGFPGIGKTELAIEFGRRKRRGIQVYCVRFAGSFLQTITGPIADAFSGYSKTFIGGAPKPQDLICREVLHLLGQCSPDDILIIDHCDSPSGIFADLRSEEYRLLCALPMHLLLTTRSEPDGEGHWERVEAMDPGVLCQIMGRHVQFPSEQLIPLIEAVGRHTLMVDLMARTMSASMGALTPANLLQAMSESGSQLPRISTTHDRSSRHAQLQVHLRTLFDLSGMSADESTVLSFAALLPADGMDALLFRQALIEEPSQEPSGFRFPRMRRNPSALRREQTALLRLTQTGWLTLTGGTLLTIHPVVREICRTDLTPDPVRCGVFLDRLWDWYGSNPYHALRYTQIAHCLAASLDRPGLLDPGRASRAGILYQQAGLYSKAREYASLALELSRERGAGNAALAQLYSNLGSAWGNLQDFDRQLECFQTALELRKRARPVNLLDLAASYSDLGTCYGARRDHGLELEYQEKALALRREHLPPDHLDLADSYSRTGGALCKNNAQCKNKKFKDGLAFQEKALRIRMLRLPADDPLLASSHINIASALHMLCRDQEALEHLLTALQIRREKLPENHPDMAQVHHNLGIAYHQLGQRQASLEHYLSCLKIYRNILSGDDPRLIRACADVAAAYSRLGQRESELEYTLQLLDLQEHTCPKGDPALIRSYSTVASTYAGLGIPEQQLVYLRKAARCGDLRSMGQLGILLIRSRQEQEGIYWLEQAADRQDIQSTYSLGTYYLSGPERRPRNLTRAVSLLERAAAAHHPKANLDLGRIFLARHPNAEGYNPIDPRRALKHLYRARELNVPGCDGLIREAESLLHLQKSEIPSWETSDILYSTGDPSC